MPGRLGGQLFDGGDPVADEPVFVVDTGPADEGNWSIVATDRSAPDGSWSVTVPNADAERYHAVAQFEDGGTLKNALSKPFLTSQPFAQPGLVTVGFDVLTPSTIGSAIPDTRVDDFEWGGPVSDRYGSGRQPGPSDFEINTDSPVFAGDFSLKFTGSTTGSILSLPGENSEDLDYYPESGDLVTGVIRDEGGDGGAHVNFSGDSSDTYYQARPSFRDGRISIGKFVSGNFTTIAEDDNVPLSSQTNFRIKLSFETDGSETQIKFEVLDGSDFDDPVLAELSATDDEPSLQNEVGFGFENDEDDSLVVWDEFFADIGGAEFD